MSEAPLLVSEWDGVLEITFNRPDKLNALNLEMWEGIAESVETFRKRSDLRVLLFRAVGRYFSAGVDLTDAEADYGDSPSQARDWMRREMCAGMHRTLGELERMEKPIVISNHAVCVGGSLELSLSCDFRLAGASAQYWLPELKFGMVPLSGGVSRLTRVVGPHWAKWMVLAQKKVSAERALIMGLVHEVYPDDALEEETRDFCRMLASNPVEGAAAGKLAIDLCVHLGLEEARQLERLTFSSLAYTREYTELADRLIKRLGGAGHVA